MTTAIIAPIGQATSSGTWVWPAGTGVVLLVAGRAAWLGWENYQKEQAAKQQEASLQRAKADRATSPLAGFRPPAAGGLDPLWSHTETIDRMMKRFEIDRPTSIPAAPSSRYAFVSYHRSEREYARKLVADLKARGITCWLDDELQHGESWEEQLARKIEGAAAVIAVMSGEEPSENVKKELTWAGIKKIPVFPISLNGGMYYRLAPEERAEVTSTTFPDDRFVKTLRAKVAST